MTTNEIESKLTSLLRQFQAEIISSEEFVQSIWSLIDTAEYRPNSESWILLEEINETLAYWQKDDSIRRSEPSLFGDEKLKEYVCKWLDKSKALRIRKS